MSRPESRCLSSKAWPTLLLLLMGFLTVAASPAQYGVPSSPNVLKPDPIRPDDDVSWGTREIQVRQLKRQREEHQKQMIADSDRLLQLATTLKKQADQGDKPTSGTLKEVEEMAKLAKRLSERIKTQ